MFATEYVKNLKIVILLFESHNVQEYYYPRFSFKFYLDFLAIVLQKTIVA